MVWIPCGFFMGPKPSLGHREPNVILNQFEFQKQNARILFPPREHIGTDAYQGTPFLR
jgi:hypothetical protein